MQPHARTAARAVLGPGVVDLPGAGLAALAAPHRRLLARVIDIALVNVLTAVIYLSFSIIGSAIGRANSDSALEGALLQQAGRIGGYILAFLVVLTLLWTYELIMISIWGATIGKMLMRVRVVKARDGSRPGFGRGFLRWLVPGLCAYVPFVGGFGTLLCYLSLFADPKRLRQGLHDKAAKTVVISTTDAGVRSDI